MNHIWKYTLDKTISGFLMPMEAKILTVQIQGDKICLWAIIEQGSIADTERSFEIIGTGHGFDANHRDYIGTIQNNGYVWHIFEII